MDNDPRPRRMRVLIACAAAALAVCVPGVAPAAAADAEVVSTLTGVQPRVSGLELEVAGGDRFLALTNDTGKQVVVSGYDDEPYLRFLPNRVVAVNTRSPSKYANEDRYALRPVPPQADSDAAPRWQTVSRDGRYRWFDHRIHLMEKGKPPQVTDESKRTKIFDWNVPMTVDGEPVKAVGTLEWVPESSSGTSALPFVGIGALVLLGGAAAVVLLRRRRAPSRGAGGRKPVEEAW